MRMAAPILLVWLAMCPAAHSQPAPSFDVASVKLLDLPAGKFFFRVPGGPPIQLSGNRAAITGSLTDLVVAAYNVRDFQVSGGPAWTDKAGRNQLYEIQARTAGDGAPSMDQVRQALQALLADRFQLKVHRDTKEMPVYSLVVAKSGPKMKESDPAAKTRTERPPNASTPFARRFINTTVQQLLDSIASQFDRPLLDKTGLKPGYDFDLEYAPKMAEAEVAAFAQRGMTDLGPPIMTALESQLGLKVVQSKEPIEIVIIDSAQRPSEN